MAKKPRDELRDPAVAIRRKALPDSEFAMRIPISLQAKLISPSFRVEKAKKLREGLRDPDIANLQSPHTSRSATRFTSANGLTISHCNILSSSESELRPP